MDGMTTYGDINQRTAAYAATTMLRHKEPVIVLQKFGMPKELPKNKADTVKFRRPIPFPAAMTPLQEGVTPTAQKMAYEDVPCTLKQWGKPIEITDWVHDVSEDPVLRDASMLAGEQAGLTTEMVTWGVVKGGTNVLYANGAARASVNTPISLNKVRLATQSLLAQKAMKLTQILDGSPKFQTRPIEAAYVFVGHTNLGADVRSLAGFTPVAEYGSRQTVSSHEIGSCEEVRFVLSPEFAPLADAGGAKAGSGTTMMSTSGVNADVYQGVFIGKESFGCVPLKGARAITPMVLNPGKPSKSDPLGQRGYVSWKAAYNAVILNEQWQLRLECAATDLN